MIQKDVFVFVACILHRFHVSGVGGLRKGGMLQPRWPHLHKLVQVMLVFQQHGTSWVSEETLLWFQL